MATDMQGKNNRGGGKKSGPESGNAKPGQPKSSQHQSGKHQSDEARTATPAMAHPWQVPVPLDDIPPQGLQRELHASAEMCASVATFSGVNYINDLMATFEVIPETRGRYSVRGQVKALVGQACVVTLEPMESQIVEQVNVTFVPPDQLPDGYNDADKLDIAALINEEEDLEPLENGAIDLGRLAVEFLILGIDPYPRKPDAALPISPAAPDPAEHPFAGLAALKGALKDKGG